MENRGTNIIQSESVDHSESFHQFVNIDGRSASEYFKVSGISERADKNGGFCWFRMNQQNMLYQNNNFPIFEDVQLEPSLKPNAKLFGKFMGTMESDNPVRRIKRSKVESLLGSYKKLSPSSEAVIEHAGKAFLKFEKRWVDTHDLSTYVVSDVSSYIPGVLDFTEFSLASALSDNKNGDSLKGYFEAASRVIEGGERVETQKLKNLAAFVHFIILKNFKSIENAPSTNLIKQFFSINKRPFTISAVNELSTDDCAELGTLIIATYDTTALSLTWLLSYLAASPEIKKQLCSIVDSKSPQARKLNMIEYYVLEAIRLGGSNPTALWRKSKDDTEVDFYDMTISIPAGTTVWLDRHKANRCAESFKNPNSFDVSNIIDLRKSNKENASSLISRARHEINSFTMLNTKRNDRKCPGRIFSIFLSSHIVLSLFRLYRVEFTKPNLDLALYSAMPIPADTGQILLKPRNKGTNA